MENIMNLFHMLAISDSNTKRMLSLMVAEISSIASEIDDIVEKGDLVDDEVLNAMKEAIKHHEEVMITNHKVEFKKYYSKVLPFIVEEAIRSGKYDMMTIIDLVKHNANVLIDVVTQNFKNATKDCSGIYPSEENPVIINLQARCLRLRAFGHMISITCKERCLPKIPDSLLKARESSPKDEK